MTLKEQYDPGHNLEEKRPKTKHEEIMFCIESTNDIVSEILELLQERLNVVESLEEAARKQGLIVG